MGNFGSAFERAFDPSAMAQGFNQGYAEAKELFKDRQLQEDAKQGAVQLQQQIAELEGHVALANDTFKTAMREGAEGKELALLQNDVTEATKGMLYQSMMAYSNFAAQNPANPYAAKIAQTGVAMVGQRMQAEAAGWKQGHERQMQERGLEAQDEMARGKQAHQASESQKERDLRRELADKSASAKLAGAKGAWTSAQWADELGKLRSEASTIVAEKWSEKELEDMLALPANRGATMEELKRGLERQTTAELAVDSRLIGSMDELLGKKSPEDAEAHDAWLAENADALEQGPKEGIFEWLARLNPMNVASLGGALGEGMAEISEEDKKAYETMGEWQLYFQGEGEAPPTRRERHAAAREKWVKETKGTWRESFGPGEQG